MSWGERPPPPYPYRFAIAVFGKKPKLKDIIRNILVNDNEFVTMPNRKLKIIDAPDVFDEDCPYPDQQIIDFMAFSHPGPHLFILAIDPENTQQEEVVAQIIKLQNIFGDKFTAHLMVTLPDIETYQSLQHLKNLFPIELKTTSETLANECITWCLNHEPFLYHYKDYSEEVVLRQKAYFNNRRCDCLPLYPHVRTGVNHHFDFQHAATDETGSGHDKGESYSDTIFNIILLGKSGTGKSASGNTILTATNFFVNLKWFESRLQSVPVTSKCEVKMIKRFGRYVRVIDTPDFFHDDLKNPQTHIEECKRYCQPGRYVALLVMQMGRFTDGERGILEKLEEKLGRIRENTIVLLTHGDNEVDVKKFIEERSYLNTVVKECSNRYQVFSNKSKDPRQVMELIRKIPKYQNVFPKLSENNQMCLFC